MKLVTGTPGESALFRGKVAAHSERLSHDQTRVRDTAVVDPGAGEFACYNIPSYVHAGKKIASIRALIRLIKIRLKRVCEAMDMLQQLRDTAYEDVDKSAVTWYYALCMDLLLDAAILIESYEVCASHAHSILG